MSRRAFSTRFRAAVGDTPIQHLANVRLGIAAGLLATSDANLFQIARSSGYDNDASLSRAFKRKFGLSPGGYRPSAAGAPRVITARAQPGEPTWWDRPVGWGGSPVNVGRTSRSELL